MYHIAYACTTVQPAEVRYAQTQYSMMHRHSTLLSACCTDTVQHALSKVIVHDAISPSCQVLCRKLRMKPSKQSTSTMNPQIMTVSGSPTAENYVTDFKFDGDPMFEVRYVYFIVLF